MRKMSVSELRRPPLVAIICPSCQLQVGFDEIVEKEGAISCVHCS